MEKYLETQAYLYIEVISFLTLCDRKTHLAKDRADRDGLVPNDDDDNTRYNEMQQRRKVAIRRYKDEISDIIRINYEHITGDILPRIKFGIQNEDQGNRRESIKSILKLIYTESICKDTTYKYLRTPDSKTPIHCLIDELLR